MLRGPAVTALLLLGLMTGMAGCGSPPPEEGLRLADRLVAGSSPADTSFRLPGLGEPPSSPDASPAAPRVLASLQRADQLLRRLSEIDLRVGSDPSPDKREVLENLIERYRELGMWNRAKTLVETLIEADPDNPRWHLVKGRIHARLGRLRPELYPEAESALRTAREFDRTRWEATLALALLLGFRVDRPGAARPLLREILQRAPDGKSELKRRAHFSLARLEHELGRDDEAARLYKSLLARRSLSSEDRTRALHNLGRIRRRQGREEEAIRAYRKAYQLQPWNSEIRRALRELGVEPSDRYDRFQ